MASNSPSRTEDLLCRVGAYRRGRNAYQAVFNRAHREVRRQDRDFYRQFVSRGDLVFDLGANEGRMAETFAELGASVVAVEPNPQLAERVRRRYGASVLAVEAAAVGAEEGIATLRLGRDSGHSTLSAAWQEAVGHAAAAERWQGSVDVRVTTLDLLIERFGLPAFIKIDVEGFEPEVLAGLSQPVPALSFEFQCAAIAIAERCLGILEDLGDYEFNLAHGELRELCHDAWMGPAELVVRIEELRLGDPGTYGDVYARLAPA